MSDWTYFRAGCPLFVVGFHFFFFLFLYLIIFIWYRNIRNRKNAAQISDTTAPKQKKIIFMCWSICCCHTFSREPEPFGNFSASPSEYTRWFGFLFSIHSLKIVLRLRFRFSRTKWPPCTRTNAERYVSPYSKSYIYVTKSVLLATTLSFELVSRFHCLNRSCFRLH